MKTGFVYTCTENWFCVHLMLWNVQGTDNRQEYHTDGTLRMSGNVQGQDRQYNEYNREFHKWPFQTDTHTHTQSQIVSQCLLVLTMSGI